MGKKDDKIKHYWERGIRNPVEIAKKMGYKGSALTPAITKIKEVITNNKLK